MSSLIIVDTDVIIDAGHKVPEAVLCFQQIEQRAILATSVITQMELIVGCHNKAQLRALGQALQRFQIVQIDELISAKAVELLARYRLSHGLLLPDALIAATALVLNLRLVSKNQRDYRFIADLQLLPYPRVFAN